MRCALDCRIGIRVWNGHARLFGEDIDGLLRLPYFRLLRLELFLQIIDREPHMIRHFLDPQVKPAMIVDLTVHIVNTKMAIGIGPN
jgi:hypothetical protein